MDFKTASISEDNLTDKQKFDVRTDAYMTEAKQQQVHPSLAGFGATMYGLMQAKRDRNPQAKSGLLENFFTHEQHRPQKYLKRKSTKLAINTPTPNLNTGSSQTGTLNI